MPISLVNQAAAFTLSSDPAHRHVIDSIIWSYSGVPIGGLTISDGGASIFDLDILIAGMNAISFRNGLASAALGNALTVTLAAGGLNIVGKLNVEWHDENA
jgi:hypothetical protein